MDKHSILKILEQIYLNDNVDNLYELIQTEKFDKALEIINEICKNCRLDYEINNNVIELRNLKYKVILENQNSILNALEQTHKIEEILLILFSKTHSPILTLILTCLSDLKNSFNKIAQLEIKQIIMILIFELSTKDSDLLSSKFSNSLNSTRLNYRYLLGYDSISEENEIITSQISIERPTMTISNSTRIEKNIYHRYNSLNQKCNQVILQNLTKSTISSLESIFNLWRHSLHSPIELNVLFSLWTDNLNEIKQQYQNKCEIKDLQDEQQLDLWSWQKINKNT